MSREHEADVPGGAALPGTLPDALRAELIAFRRDMHMHPELGNHEFRTTAALKARLEQAGLKPRVLDIGTGLICDIGIDGDAGPDGEVDGGRGMLALRADIITTADLMLDRVGGSLTAAPAGVAAANNVALTSASATNEADLRTRRAAALEESGDVGLSEYLDKAAGERIARALAKAKGNRAEAARSLGIGRATLYRFMRRLGNESIAERHDNEPAKQQ